ncbi:hypothetical protein Cni_G00559 [Canna indica]|uniref:Uncharacterized protein n=1 Tax=Canna indica TaxID=4628 RepID=A0AAQ3PXD3_9LILI|nr:hypothetical protein Cni_G00559 [Canna indica]
MHNFLMVITILGLWRHPMTTKSIFVTGKQRKQAPTASPTTNLKKKQLPPIQKPPVFCLEGMAAAPSPVEVGARGTIGSLVSQEIEYLRRLNFDGHGVYSQKQVKLSMDIASTSGGCKQKPSSSKAVQKRKKKLGTGGGFLPSMCSAVDVTDASRVERISGIGYRNLRSDGKKLPDE